MNTRDTSTELLDAAQRLVQERGYNAFSYRDLANAVNIRTASIHYHFRAKADLGQALMERYLADLEQSLAEINRSCRTNEAKLKRFVDLYRETETRGDICLCGSLAADFETLPEPLQRAVSAYLARSESWVTATIDDGVRSGEFVPSGDSADAATALVASLQGGLILSRVTGGAKVLDNVQYTFLKALRSK